MYARRVAVVQLQECSRLFRSSTTLVSLRHLAVTMLLWGSAADHPAFQWTWTVFSLCWLMPGGGPLHYSYLGSPVLLYLEGNVELQQFVLNVVSYSVMLAIEYLVYYEALLLEANNTIASARLDASNALHKLQVTENASNMLKRVFRQHYSEAGTSDDDLCAAIRQDHVDRLDGQKKLVRAQQSEKTAREQVESLEIKLRQARKELSKEWVRFAQLRESNEALKEQATRREGELEEQLHAVTLERDE